MRGTIIIALGAISATIPPQAPREFQSSTAMTMIATDQATIEAFCGKAPLGWNKVACAESTSRTIVVPNPCHYNHERYAAILCHELAHLNGWKHKERGDK